MAIPVLIRVLWLMFDEQGDRSSGCFLRVFTPVSCAIPSATQEAEWAAHSPWYVLPPTPSLHSSEELFSMFLPLRVVSALKETTVIAKPCTTKQSVQFNLGFHKDSFLKVILIQFLCILFFNNTSAELLERCRMTVLLFLKEIL